MLIIRYPVRRLDGSVCQVIISATFEEGPSRIHLGWTGEHIFEGEFIAFVAASPESDDFYDEIKTATPGIKGA